MQPLPCDGPTVRSFSIAGWNFRVVSGRISSSEELDRYVILFALLHLHGMYVLYRRFWLYPLTVAIHSKLSKHQNGGRSRLQVATRDGFWSQ